MKGVTSRRSANTVRERRQELRRIYDALDKDFIGNLTAREVSQLDLSYGLRESFDRYLRNSMPNVGLKDFVDFFMAALPEESGAWRSSIKVLTSGLNRTV